MALAASDVELLVADAVAVAVPPVAPLPVALPTTNLYAYRPLTVPAGGQIPIKDSTAYYSPTQAALLLFRIPVTEFDNRPLTLTLTDPTDPSKTATVTLDV